MSKLPEIIKELEQLANEKSDDYYHADCLEEQQDLAEKSLSVIKQLQEENKKLDLDVQALQILLKCARVNLAREYEKNLYTEEGHVKKTEKSLHEKSIWKPISQILEDYSHCYIRYASGNIKLAQSIEGKFFGIDDNIDNDHYINVKEYCTLTDFINKQESLEQRITDLEKRLTN